MRDLGRLIWSVLLVLLRSRAALAAENLVLRQQINVLRRTAPKRPFLGNVDRLIFVCLYRLFPGVRNVLAIVKPETIIRWHRWGFRAYWRWRSRIRGGRPKVPLEIARLIREISFANPNMGLSMSRSFFGDYQPPFWVRAPSSVGRFGSVESSDYALTKWSAGRSGEPAIGAPCDAAT